MFASITCRWRLSGVHFVCTAGFYINDEVKRCCEITLQPMCECCGKFVGWHFQLNFSLHECRSHLQFGWVLGRRFQVELCTWTWRLRHNEYAHISQRGSLDWSLVAKSKRKVKTFYSILDAGNVHSGFFSRITPVY